MYKLLLLLITTLFVNLCYGQSTAFSGIPSIKISESGFERVSEKIDSSKALSVSCIVKEVDGKFFWETRGNKPLLRVESGAFFIFFAVDGSGYIRVIEGVRYFV